MMQKCNKKQLGAILHFTSCNLFVSVEMSHPYQEWHGLWAGMLS